MSTSRNIHKSLTQLKRLSGLVDTDEPKSSFELDPWMENPDVTYGIFHPWMEMDFMKKHMETPIDFSIYCTLKRDIKLTIPCDVEISHTNYATFEKVKM